MTTSRIDLSRCRTSPLIVAAIVLLAGGLPGCGTGHTAVTQAPVTGQHFRAAWVEERDSTVEVPLEDKADFAADLVKDLAKQGFANGDGLKITYRFIQYDIGSQSARWAMHGLGSVGQGKLIVEAEFTNEAGRSLAKISAEGQINGGLTGGSFAHARARAAEQVAEYAGKYFK